MEKELEEKEWQIKGIWLTCKILASDEDEAEKLAEKALLNGEFEISMEER